MSESKEFGKQKEDQGKFDIGISKHTQHLISLAKDEPVDKMANTVILIRKFWFRMKLHCLYRKKQSEENFGVLFLGSGGDSMGNSLREKWKVFKMDKIDFEGVTKIDVNKDYKKIEEFVEKNNIQLLVMEGLTYYLELEPVKFLLDLATRRKMLLLLDGFDQKMIDVGKDILDFKTALPLDLLPPNCTVVETKHAVAFFGEEMAGAMDSNIYFVSNF